MERPDEAIESWRNAGQRMKDSDKWGDCRTIIAWIDHLETNAVQVIPAREIQAEHAVLYCGCWRDDWFYNIDTGLEIPNRQAMKVDLCTPDSLVAVRALPAPKTTAEIIAEELAQWHDARTGLSDWDVTDLSGRIAARLDDEDRPF